MIEILLATYNGERFLPEQIESILNQSFQDFKVLAGDDGSGDYTLEILKGYENIMPDKVKAVSVKAHGAKENFYNLLDMAEGDYICLCDQDDFWERDKLEKNLSAIVSLEEEYGKDTPILVHSDLELTDENLNSSGKKMSQICGIKGLIKTATLSKTLKGLYIMDNNRGLGRILAENNITGNSLIFNKALLRLYKRPEVSFMHDWWLGILAYSFGKVGFIDECLVKYRQHENNELGAVSPLEVKNLQNRISSNEKVRKNYELMYDQAREFIRLYKEEEETKETLKVIKAFANMRNKSRISKIFDICKYGFFKSSPVLTIGEMLNI